MARPRNDQPTPSELEVLQTLWRRGPSTVRQVMRELNRDRRRAYTSVMSLMNVMAEKGLLSRKPKGRAFVYTTRQTRTKTLSSMVGDLLSRAFGGSASAMVAHLLDQAQLSQDELAEIRQAIAACHSEGGQR